MKKTKIEKITEMEDNLNIVLEYRNKLEELSEPKYQKFASALIPGVDNLIGVRIPLIRKLAKEIIKKDPVKYLKVAEDKYFEEIMLQALVIGQLKMDIEIVINEVEKFIPKIDNWSVCDSFCNDIKIVRANKDKIWKFFDYYWHSTKEYEIRFSVVTMLFYYIEDDYIDHLFDCFNYISHQSYYVKMSVAWAISMCFVKYPVKTMQYLKNNCLDNETYNKVLQKIRESMQVDESTKKIIKQMKRV